MNLPQFTAEASLYMTKVPYRASVPAISNECGVFAATGTGGFCHRGSRTCYGHCLQQDLDDPYAEENCRCCCTGHPGHDCFYQ